MQNENLSQLGQSLISYNRVSVLAFYWNHRDEAHRRFKLFTVMLREISIQVVSRDSVLLSCCMTSQKRLRGRPGAKFW